ncbi:MAG TPA: DUF1704 domain-containing protein [Polyangiaceae bacterium]|nr:DUF1704 domain-containing protein [Polyangiaceae bacterium]
MNLELREASSQARALRPAAELLAEAAREARLLGAATPVNLTEERARLAQALARGECPRPRWRYGRGGRGELRARLTRLARALEGVEGPLAALYLARAEELALECALVGAVGTGAFGPLAARRFLEAEGVERGLDFAREHVGDHEPEAALGPSLPSHDPSPSSLVSRMRAELSARGIPFRVCVVEGLSALAATGDGAVFVAHGRETRGDDVPRTVLHELDGHVLPRVRAAAAPLALFRFGAARATDDQEGYALLLEERGGFLGPARRRELSARRVAVQLAVDGASYGECARALMTRHAFEAGAAARLAERVYRGGDGVCLGLARDRVYLDAWLRLRAAFAEEPHLEGLVSGGQISLAAARALAGHPLD